MSAKMHLAAGLIGAIGIVAAFAAPASAQGGVNVGTLTCNASAGIIVLRRYKSGIRVGCAVRLILG